MKAEIISIGDELLIGQTINTNAARMGEMLNREGFYLTRVTVVGDSAPDILDALAASEKRCDVVLITGGLGPTKDDLTKDVLCTYFETRLIENREMLARVTDFFSSLNRPLLESNARQAMLPENCVVLPNDKGTASGMWFEKNGVVFISLPGVPFEMEHLMEDRVIPRLKERYLAESVIHKTIMTQGIGESFLAEMIAAWEDGLADRGLKLAYLPSPGMVKLRISSYGGDPAVRQQEVNKAVQELYGLIPAYIYGEDEEAIEKTVGKLLKQGKRTLAIAESCTGGFIAHLITSVPGSSAYFKGSITAYANSVKENVLGVTPGVISRHGVVSTETAEEMAKQVRELLGADYGLATTGIAGPEGGTEDNPVGTVCTAVAGKNRVVSERQKFGRDRLRVIERSTRSALNLLRKELQKDFSN